MSRFGARSKRFAAAVWVIAVALEVAVFELATRISDSWVLLLGLLLVVIPLAAGEITWRWFSRPRRKRWKRHDLEDAAKAEEKARQAGLGARSEVG